MEFLHIDIDILGFGEKSCTIPIDLFVYYLRLENLHQKMVSGTSL